MENNGKYVQGKVCEEVQKRFLDKVIEIDKKLDKLNHMHNRAPVWASLAITVLTAICAALITYKVQ